MPGRKRRARSVAPTKTSRMLNRRSPSVGGALPGALIYSTRPRPAPLKELSLLSFDLQVEDNLFFVVEAGDGARRGLGAVLFSMNLIIDVRVQAAEAIVALVIRDVTAYRIGTRIS